MKKKTWLEDIAQTITKGGSKMGRDEARTSLEGGSETIQEMGWEK